MDQEEECLWCESALEDLRDGACASCLESIPCVECGRMLGEEEEEEVRLCAFGCPRGMHIRCGEQELEEWTCPRCTESISNSASSSSKKRPLAGTLTVIAYYGDREVDVVCSRETTMQRFFAEALVELNLPEARPCAFGRETDKRNVFERLDKSARVSNVLSDQERVCIFFEGQDVEVTWVGEKKKKKRKKQQHKRQLSVGVEMTVEQLRAVVPSLCDKLGAVANELGSSASAYVKRMEDAAKLVAAAWGTVRWTVVGSMGGGKSELINRIIMGQWGTETGGKEPLPSSKGAFSVTHELTEVSWADAFCVQAVFEDESVKHYELKLAISLLDGVAKVHEALKSEWLTEEERVRLDHLVVRGPFPGLQERKDLVLVDTPGFGDTSAGVEERTQKQIAKSQALMVVANRLDPTALERVFKMMLEDTESVLFDPHAVPCLVAAYTEGDDVSAEQVAATEEEWRDVIEAAMAKSLLQFQRERPSRRPQALRDAVVRMRKTSQVFRRNASVRVVGHYVELIRKHALEGKLERLSLAWASLNYFLNQRLKSGKIEGELARHKTEKDKVARHLREVEARARSLWNPLATSEISMLMNLAVDACLKMIEANEWGADVECALRRDKTYSWVKVAMDMLVDGLLDHGRAVVQETTEQSERVAISLNFEAISVLMQARALDTYKENLRDLKRSLFERLTDADELLWMARHAAYLLKAGSPGEQEDDDERRLVVKLALIDLLTKRGAQGVRHNASVVSSVRKHVTLVLLKVTKWAKDDMKAEKPIAVDGESRERLKQNLKQLRLEWRDTFSRYVTPRWSNRRHKPKATDLSSGAPQGASEADLRTLVVDTLCDSKDNFPALKESHWQLVVRVEEEQEEERGRVLHAHWRGKEEEEEEDTLELLMSVEVREVFESHARALQETQRAVEVEVPEGEQQERQINARLSRQTVAPVFCMAFADKEVGNMSQVCNSKLFNHTEDLQRGRLLLVYVVYEDQLENFRSLLAAENVGPFTYLLSLPKDASVRVGLDLVNKLCGHFDLGLWWSLPYYANARMSRFHLEVMSARTCSALSALYFAQQAQLMPLLAQAKARMVQCIQSHDLLSIMVQGGAMDMELMPRVAALRERVRSPMRVDLAFIQECLEVLRAHDLFEDVLSAFVAEALPLLGVAHVMLHHQMAHMPQMLGDLSSLHGCSLAVPSVGKPGLLLHNVMSCEGQLSYLGKVKGTARGLMRNRPTTLEEFEEHLRTANMSLMRRIREMGAVKVVNTQFMWGGSQKARLRGAAKRAAEAAAAAPKQKKQKRSRSRKKLLKRAPVTATEEAITPEQTPKRRISRSSGRRRGRLAVEELAQLDPASALESGLSLDRLLTAGVIPPNAQLKMGEERGWVLPGDMIEVSRKRGDTTFFDAWVTQCAHVMRLAREERYSQIVVLDEQQQPVAPLLTLVQTFLEQQRGPKPEAARALQLAPRQKRLKRSKGKEEDV